MSQYGYDSRKTVCYKCEDREVGCHSICERYLEEKKRTKEQIEKYVKETKPIGFSCKTAYKFFANQFYRS